MGRRGPPPKPTALRVLSGNASKRRLNREEPTPPSGEISPPVWLEGQGLKVWEWLAPVLGDMAVLTTADPHSLGLLSDAYAEYIEHQAYLREHGRTYESRHLQMDTDGNTFERVIIRPRPEVGMMQDAWKRTRAGMQDFGLNPSARSRIRTADPKGEEDPFDAWRKRGNSS
jgi:P27 family predicted phage terminase small subunit